jgi:hypothetical protein
MGIPYKRRGSKKWMMAVYDADAGKQVCKSTRTKSKLEALEKLLKWEREISDGQKSEPPYFENWADDFQTKVPYESTRKRYESSIKKLKEKFTGILVVRYFGRADRRLA